MARARARHVDRRPTWLPGRVGAWSGLLSAAIGLSVGCRPPAATPPPTAGDKACARALSAAIDEARAPDVDLVYVQATDEQCDAAARRAAEAPDVQPWRRSPRRCLGRSCGPRDGNPLISIEHAHEECFRVTTLRFGGGSGVTRCVGDDDSPPELRDVVLY